MSPISETVTMDCHELGSRTSAVTVKFWGAPSRSTAMRLPMVMASTWSWVT